MRCSSWLWLAVFATACTYAPPPVPAPLGIDGRLDAAEAADFCDKWNALQGRDTPEAALLRAQLGLQVPRSVLREASCIDENQLRLQCSRDAIRATQGLPENPSAWMLLAAWLERTPAAPEAVAEAACKGAQLSSRDPTAWLACGDWRRRANDAAGAVEAWKKSFELEADRDAQCALVARIRESAAAPAALGSLPQAVVQDCEQRRAAEEKRLEEQRLRDERSEQSGRCGSGRCHHAGCGWQKGRWIGPDLAEGCSGHTLPPAPAAPAPAPSP